MMQGGGSKENFDFSAFLQALSPPAGDPPISPDTPLVDEIQPVPTAPSDKPAIVPAPQKDNVRYPKIPLLLSFGTSKPVTAPPPSVPPSVSGTACGPGAVPARTPAPPRPPLTLDIREGRDHLPDLPGEVLSGGAIIAAEPPRTPSSASGEHPRPYVVSKGESTRGSVQPHPPEITHVAQTAMEVSYNAITSPLESSEEKKSLHANLTPLFQEMVKRKASDLHLGAATTPTLRIDGEFQSVEIRVPQGDELARALLSFLSPRQQETFLNTGDIDFALQIPHIARLRANYYRQYRGIAAAFRLIPGRVPPLDSLGLPPVVKGLAGLKRGLVIVTGPTGSGKSTTLAAIVNEINTSRSCHIITIEDPVEFVHESKRSLITHREIGFNAISFSEAIRAAIREDPDIVLVGEMRDLDTIYQSIKAAEMGLLVFGTLHTNNASMAMDRIIDVFPPDQQEQIRTMLADSLKAVVAQQLLRRATGEGRVAALEILLAVPGFSNLIREGKTHQIASIIQTGKDVGMQSMDQGIIELVKKGLVSVTEGLSRATDPRTFYRAGILADSMEPEADGW